MNQLQMIYNYNNENKIKFNPKLFYRDDSEILEDIISVIRCCERDGIYKIKIASYKVIDDPMEINSILYENEERSLVSKRKKNKSLENCYDFIPINDTDLRLLIVTYNVVDAKGKDDSFDVIIAIPRIVHDNCFRIQGNLYVPMNQIVDSSTYNNSKTKSRKDTVTMKTIFGPIIIYRNIVKLKTVNKEEVHCTSYSARIFTKTMNGIQFILARCGFNNSLQFLGLKGIHVSDTPFDNEDPMVYVFKKHNIFIRANRELFDGDPMTQTFVATIIGSIQKTTTINDIFDIDFWLSTLGKYYGSFTPLKGVGICESLTGLYDFVIQRSMEVPYYEKASIYHVLRWMMKEFSNLKIKDNLNLFNKRIRFSEYIAAGYAIKLAPGIHRLTDMGARVTVKDMRRALMTNPMYLVTWISKSPLVNYKNTVNDLDSIAVLKYTFKGISGIGENSNSTIPDSARRIYPSYLGYIDLDASSPSDPGLSGVICPMIDIECGKFMRIPEPLTWHTDYHKLYKGYMDKNEHMFPFKEVDTNTTHLMPFVIDDDEVEYPIVENRCINPFIDIKKLGDDL